LDHSNQNREKTWALVCHLSALIMLTGIPFSNLLGPLIVWLIKKNEMPLVQEEGKKALNFQLSMTIYTLVAFLLCFVYIGFLLIFPIIVANIIFVIIASVKTSNGENYQYPFTFQFIK